MLNVGVREALHRLYSDPSHHRGAWVDLYIAIGDHATRALTPFSPKTGISDGGWVVENEEIIRVGVKQPNVVVRQIRRGENRRLIYHWYEGSGGFGDEVFRSLFALDQSPFRRPEASVVVRLGTQLADSSGSSRLRAEERLQRFFDASRELRAWAIGDL